MFKAEKRIASEAEAWFFYSVEGADQPPAVFIKEEENTPNVKLNLLEQVVDPQFMVQSLRGLPLDQIERFQKDWGYLDWLKELIRLCFSSPWVWFWNNSYQQMYYTPDREKLFLEDLREQWKASKGPLRDLLLEFIRKAEKDPSLYLVRRGSKYRKERRVVGSDESFVYLYNNKEQLLTRLPMFSFWKGVNITQISTEIYAVTWVSLGVVGFAVIGPAVIVNGARQYFAQKIKEEAIQAAFHRQSVALKDRLFLMIVNSVLLPVWNLHRSALAG